MRFIDATKRERKLRDNQALDLPFARLRSQKVELEKIIEKASSGGGAEGKGHFLASKEQKDAVLLGKALLKRVNSVLELL